MEVNPQGVVLNARYHTDFDGDDRGAEGPRAAVSDDAAVGSQNRFASYRSDINPLSAPNLCAQASRGTGFG